MIIICSCCRQPKDSSLFGKSSTRKNGHSPYCKPCVSAKGIAYRKTDSYKETRKKINHSDPRFKAYYAKYGKSAKGKATARRYKQSEKGKAATRRSVDKYNKAHPEKACAHQKIASAIMSGYIQKASSKKCYFCGKQATEHHHYLGYEKEHHLDVQAVCRACHISAHS